VSMTKAIILAVGTAQVGVSAALATQAMTPPPVHLSGVWAMGLLVASACLTYLQTQMQAWKDVD